MKDYKKNKNKRNSINRKINERDNNKLVENYNNSDENFFDLSISSDYYNLDYGKQLILKENMIKDIFPNYKVNNIIKSPKELGYRHKVILSATNRKNKNNKYEIKLGLYKEGSKTIIPNLDDKIHHPDCNEVFKTVENVLQKYKIEAYHENNSRGIIKHVLIKKSFYYNEMMLVFVTQGNIFPNNKQIIKEIRIAHPNIVTVVQNIHNKNTSIVILDNEVILYGPGYIRDKIKDLEFRLSSQSFYQVNPELMFLMYDYAINISNIKENMRILDTYSGIGTISLLLTKYAKDVIAVEINKEAHLNAIYNKQKNNIKNIKFINNDVIDFIKTFDEKVDILFMDPTRTGASPDFLSAVIRLKPNKILYISCDPRTQSRDVKLLENVYEIKSIQPFDMFPYTNHVENIVLLSLK